MSGVWGQNIKISIFGESHGKCIGVVISGLPAGLELDFAFIRREMARRAPGKGVFSTPRKEGDEVEVLSGYFNGRTTGAPLSSVIWNTSQRSEDYATLKDIVRPGHADYTARVKYLGFHDYRGGGHFSGRLTAPLVFAGAVAKQILGKKDIIIGSHIQSIGEISEEPFDPVKIRRELLIDLTASDFPVMDEEKGIKMKELILKAREEKDSVGGVVETAVVNLPAGIGSPVFDSVESIISHLLFSIPAVKGVEFGAGFGITRMKGSQANDEFVLEEGRIATRTNNNGGILGGITSGMPLIFRTAFKPTPSIGKPQKTVDLSRGENVEIEIKGRHDPCIVPRAVPAVEAAAALALLDLMMEKDGTAWII